MSDAVREVLIQAGHSSAFDPWLPAGGGAPGEAAWTTALASLMQRKCAAAGISTTLVGHWYGSPAPAVVSARPYALALFLHYDAAIYTPNTGGFTDRYRPINPAGNPNAAKEDLFIATWERLYPQATGIPLHNERRNPNTDDYYGYAGTPQETCGVLIEHGVGQGLDHDTLFTRMDAVANANVATIVAWMDAIAPQPAPAPAPTEDDEAMLTPSEREALALLRALSWDKDSISTAISRIGRAVEIGKQLQPKRLSVAARQSWGQEMQAWGG